MAELKPCPFCGVEPVVTKHHNRFTEWYLCSCPKCHISQTGSEYGFRFEAVEAWNRRVNVVHGQWGKNEFLSDDVNSAAACSLCGELIGWFGNDFPPYCPYCGARMDGTTERSKNE